MAQEPSGECTTYVLTERTEKVNSDVIYVENGVESAKIVTNVQTFRHCALLQWNVR